MKSTEFRTGNLVSTINRDGAIHIANKFPMRVTCINNFDLALTNPKEPLYKTTRVITVPIKDIFPITLTEEWLCSFRFSSNPYEDRYELGGFYIHCDKTSGFLDLWVVNCQKDLKYVHQLQNLYFAMTGQELEYTIN